MARESGRKLVASNRKARHDYHIDDTFEAGLVLTGTEVKALRAGRASLVDGYATVDNGEAWLEGVHIPEYTEGTWTNHAPRRKRKLLLHRREIAELEHETQAKGVTIVPLSLYFVDGRPAHDCRRRLIAAWASRSACCSRRVFRLSYSFLPRARAISTLARGKKEYDKRCLLYTSDAADE